MLSRELKSGFLFLFLSLLVFYECRRIGIGVPSKPGSGFLAFCAGIVLLGLALSSIHRGWKVRENKITHGPKVILAFAIVIAYSLLLEFLGFVPATFLAVTGLLRLQMTRPWWSVVGAGAAITAVAYVVFGILLQVYFPIGFLGV
jgi:hypothetical protein